MVCTSGPPRRRRRPRSRALLAAAGFLSFWQLPPLAAEVEIQAGLRYASATYDASTRGDVGVVDVSIAPTFGRHRLAFELTGITSSTTDASAFLLTRGRVLRALESDRAVPDRALEVLAEGPEVQRQSGIGDVVIAFDSTLIGGTAEALTVVSIIEAKVPVADPDTGLGTGEWDYRLGALAERRFWSTTLIGELGYNFLGDQPGFPLENGFDLTLGLETRELRGDVVLGLWFDVNEEVVAGTGERALIGLSVARRSQRSWRAEIDAGLTDGAEDWGARLHFGVSSRRRRW